MPTTKTRLNKIANIILPVADQDRAVAFYVDQLGFAKRVDLPYGDGERWVEVGLGNEATTIALAPPPAQGTQTGNRETGICLQTDDIDGFHAQLTSNGVDVDDVIRMGDPVPPMFWLRDPEGNSLLVLQ
jgi:catechol 2,3-dioxygenase-like lactoylglutathione lyase family enzyme